MIDEKRAKRYCCGDIRDIENYERAVVDEAIWDCHHRAEILPCGVYSVETLKRHHLYWSVPPAQLVFIPHTEHTRLHMSGKNHPRFGKSSWNKGKHHTDETRRKISRTEKGKHVSEETRRKLRDAWKRRRRLLDKTSSTSEQPVT